MLAIGDEILSGERLDSNAGYFVKRLKEKNINLELLIFVGDSINEIVDSFRFLTQLVNFIIISGGLGLTPDDITLNAISKATGLKLIKSREKRKVVEQNLSNIPHTKYADYIDRLSIALETSLPIPNPVGIAAGEELVFNNAKVFILPGVPSEFESMLTMYVLPKLAPNADEASFSYLTNATEASIIDFLETAERNYSVKTSSYPPVLGEKFLRVKFKGRGDELLEVSAVFEKLLLERGLYFEKKTS